MPRRAVARSAVALTALAAVAYLCGVSAQTPPPQTPPAQAPPPQTTPNQTPQPQRPLFRAGVDVISVDATVTDSKGNLITDLTADDFEIKENNKPQKIESFKLIQIDDTLDIDPGRYPEIHSMADQEREGARDDVRMFVLFLDDYHIRRGNDIRIREQLARFIRTLSPRDMVAVMYPLTPTGAITFTRNFEGVANAVMKLRGRKYDYRAENAYEDIYAKLTPQEIETLRLQVTRTALSSICTYMGTLREGRKSILFVSEGFVSTVPAAIQRAGLGLPPLGMAGQAPTNAPGDVDDRVMFANQLAVLQEMKPLFDDAKRSNTNIYSIDPRGLATSEFDVSQPAVDSKVDRRMLNESMDTLRVISDQSEGQAIVNYNDIAAPLKQILHQMTAYYLMGYTTTETKHDGKFHEIKVNVKRKGLTVRSRQGYYAYTEDDVARAAAPPAPSAPKEITEALSALAQPTRGKTVSTWIGMDRGPDNKASVTLVWEAAARPGSRDEVPDRVDVIAGSASGESAFRGKVPKDPKLEQASGKITFAAKPGMLNMRLTSQTADGAQIDVDTLDVPVPDFTTVGPAISTPAVYRVRTARDVQQMATGVTPMPAITREFSRSERLVFRFNAYGPGDSAPVVTARLLNKNGDAVSTLPPPSKGADGFYQVDLPLAGLAAGSFLVEIEATSRDGAKVKALIAFVVTA